MDGSTYYTSAIHPRASLPSCFTDQSKMQFPEYQAKLLAWAKRMQMRTQEEAQFPEELLRAAEAQFPEELLRVAPKRST